MTGKDAYSCKDCFGFFGPRPPSLDFPPESTQSRFCSIVMTPDETGTEKECGGHGVYQDGMCHCDASAEDGYWKTMAVTQDFIRTLGNGSTQIETITVQTCSVCLYDNLLLENGCQSSIPLYEIQQELAITLEPTTLDYCTSCLSYGKTYPTTSIDNLNITGSFIPFSDCCDMDYYYIYQDYELRVYNGTCLDTETNRRHMASIICQHLEGCDVYVIHETREYSSVTFYPSLQGNARFVFSVLSESGQVCSPTSSPTRPTTQYPTSM